MQLIDGKKIANELKQEIALEVQQMRAEGKKVPHLATILVGHDGGSPRWRGSVTRANISIHIANNKGNL